MERIRVAVVGASGYTGAELLRLLVDHPRVELVHLSAHRNAGQRVDALFPHLLGRVDLTCRVFDADEVSAVAQLAFLALPHGESAAAASALLSRGVRVFDLSADFRLHDPAVHAQWYGTHLHPELLSQAVYGLPELHRAELPGAKLVAVPGCYPTATILALSPLVRAGCIRPEGLVVDAKSGTTGGGRTPSLAFHFSEIGESVRAYKVAEHRHTPEIEQELSAIAGVPIVVTFTPHLLPMSRGILSTCYATPTDPSAPREVYVEALRKAYQGERFVQVVDRPPDTAFVRGSNRVHVGVWLDTRAKRVIVMGAIDNLVKGAAGQAVQAMNCALGWDEAIGVDAVGVFP